MAKILVVEDVLDTRELLHLHLTSEGFEVILAVNGQEGLYLATAERPDLIIADMEMPVLNGNEMIKELRAQKETRDIPILVLTAYGKDVMDKAIKAGANRAMMKPILLEGLITDVQELLAGAINKKGLRK
jgi:two-component system, cell cycle response regulator DivK